MSLGVRRYVMPGTDGRYTEQPDQPDRKQDRMHHDARMDRSTHAQSARPPGLRISAAGQQRNQAGRHRLRVRLLQRRDRQRGEQRRQFLNRGFPGQTRQAGSFLPGVEIHSPQQRYNAERQSVPILTDRGEQKGVEL